MKITKRNFLKLSSISALGVLSPFGKMAAFANSPSADSHRKSRQFGLQLWTVKDEMANDAKATLKMVADAGYQQIESFEGKQGMFWGMTSKGFKSYMDSLGTSVISAHCNIDVDFEKKAAEAASIGMKYLICPWLGPQESLDKFKKFADNFNKCGEICKKNGLRFAYHNHDYSFIKVEGQLPQEVMLSLTDPNLVDFQMDIYWVVASGNDPQEWLKKYKNRFKLCHVKDLAKVGTNMESTILGKGTIDFKSILTTAAANGMQYYIVEQEAFTGTTPLKAIAEDAKYFQQLS